MPLAQRRPRWDQTLLLATMVAGSWTTPGAAAELMPTAQQNAMVRKYCTVCHTDAARNGGLSLQHFDAAQASPSLIAMLLSKITGGAWLQTARDAHADARAAAFVEQRMRSGAMGAAGLPLPDQATIRALIHAFATESAGATNWTVERSNHAAGDAPRLTASLLREVVSAKEAGVAELYRVIASCNSLTREGQVQVA